MPLKTAPAPPDVPPFKTMALPLQEAAQPEPRPSTVERALEMPAAAHAAAAPKTRVIRLERSFGTLNPTSAGLAGIGVRFITYAGMIRGAIALGLAIKATHFFSEYEFVVASVLALVIISTLLFGSFMPLVAKCLLDPPKKQGKHNSAQMDLVDLNMSADSKM